MDTKKLKKMLRLTAADMRRLKVEGWPDLLVEALMRIEALERKIAWQKKKLDQLESRDVVELYGPGISGVP